MSGVPKLPPIKPDDSNKKLSLEFRENTVAAIRRKLAEQEKVEREFAAAAAKLKYKRPWVQILNCKPVAELEVGEYYARVGKEKFDNFDSGYCVVNDDQGAIFLINLGIREDNRNTMNKRFYLLKLNNAKSETNVSTNLLAADKEACDKTPMVQAWKKAKPANREAFKKWLADFTKQEQVQKEFAAAKKNNKSSWVNYKEYTDTVKPVAELKVGEFYKIVDRTLLGGYLSGYCVVNDDQGAIFLTDYNLTTRIHREASGFMNKYFCLINESKDPGHMFINKCDNLPIVQAWKALKEEERPATREAFEKWAADFTNGNKKKTPSRPTPSRPKGSSRDGPRQRRARYIDLRF